MTGVPQNFQAISNVLANYNFVDIASGTGYITFYAGSTVDKYILSNNTYYSHTVYTNYSNNSGSLVKGIDIDFDVLLNRPLDVEGLMIVNVPSRGIYSNGAYAGNIKIVATFSIVSGGVETVLATNEATSSGDNVTTYKMMGIDLTIPNTHFKIGDTLRLTVEGWVQVNTGGGTACQVAIAYDPKNRSSEWDTTGAVPSQLIFQCPVRLNL